VQIYAADPGPDSPTSASEPASSATVPGELPTDITPGELVAEFRGRSRTISKK
jgi:acyl-CoA thioesterase